MRATLGSTLLAEAPDAEVLSIEGSRYFPPTSLTPGVLAPSETRYDCTWRGTAHYWHVGSGEDELPDGAWSFPSPAEGSAERVGTDFTDYVAFDPRVTLTQ